MNKNDKNFTLFSKVQLGAIILSGVVMLVILVFLLLWEFDLLIYHPLKVSGPTNTIEILELIPLGLLLLIFQPLSSFVWYPLLIGNLLYLLFFLIKRRPTGKLKIRSYIAVLATLILLAIASYFSFFIQWQL